MTNYADIHCHECGNQVCQNCGCCATGSCLNASCPDQDDDSDDVAVYPPLTSVPCITPAVDVDWLPSTPSDTDMANNLPPVMGERIYPGPIYLNSSAFSSGPSPISPLQEGVSRQDVIRAVEKLLKIPQDSGDKAK